MVIKNLSKLISAIHPRSVNGKALWVVSTAPRNVSTIRYLILQSLRGPSPMSSPGMTIPAWRIRSGSSDREILDEMVYMQDIDPGPAASFFPRELKAVWKLDAGPTRVEVACQWTSRGRDLSRDLATEIARLPVETFSFLAGNIFAFDRLEKRRITKVDAPTEHAKFLDFAVPACTIVTVELVVSELTPIELSFYLSTWAIVHFGAEGNFPGMRKNWSCKSRGECFSVVYKPDSRATGESIRLVVLGRCRQSFQGGILLEIHAAWKGDGGAGLAQRLVSHLLEVARHARAMTGPRVQRSKNQVTLRNGPRTKEVIELIKTWLESRPVVAPKPLDRSWWNPSHETSSRWVLIIPPA